MDDLTLPERRSLSTPAWDLYVGGIEAPLVRNLLHCSGEFFLNASIAPSVWA